MNAIEARGLSKNYGQVNALRDVSFSVSKGEVIGLLGPNGAGKTTLMKIITGYIQPDHGDAQIVGNNVVETPLAVQAKIGYLPESAPLYGEMLVQEYLQMMAELRGIEESKRKAFISEAVQATGLGPYLTRAISNLSKGYKQRVGIAQAIVHKPELLILDEPTSGLDPSQIVEIRALIKHLSEHSTVMLSTHILPEVEMTCERVLMIIKGQLRLDAPLSELQSPDETIVIAQVDDNASGAQQKFQSIQGVADVKRGSSSNGFREWRITSKSNRDLAVDVFETLRTTDFRVREVRSESKNLEAVFREFAEHSPEQAKENSEKNS